MCPGIDCQVVVMEIDLKVAENIIAKAPFFIVKKEGGGRME